MPALLVAWSDAALAGERARMRRSMPSRHTLPKRSMSRRSSSSYRAASRDSWRSRRPTSWCARRLRAMACGGARGGSSGALPDPTVEMSVFLQAIETRTGPQQGRIGLRQGCRGRGFWWPAPRRRSGEPGRRGAIRRTTPRCVAEPSKTPTGTSGRCAPCAPSTKITTRWSKASRARFGGGWRWARRRCRSFGRSISSTPE